MRRLLLALALALLSTGCTAPTTAPPPGTATPTTTDAPSPAPTPGSTRPRELRLDDVDPCELLTPTQIEALGLRESSKRAFTTTAPIVAGRACSLGGSEPRAVSIGFALALGNGIEAVTAPGGVTDQLTPITVAGFPAVLARPANPDGCFVDVDVADGQLLDVLFRDGGRKPPIPQEQLCRDAVLVAEQAVATLLAG